MAKSFSDSKIAKLMDYLQITDHEDEYEGLSEMTDEAFDEYVRNPIFFPNGKIRDAFEFLHQVAIQNGVSVSPAVEAAAPVRVNRKYVVAIFKWPLNIGLPFVHSSAKGLSIVMKNAIRIPRAYYHAGVVVFNTLFHYGPSGLQAHLEMPSDWIGELKLQTTNRTRNEFDHWLHEASERFKAADYQFATLNCIAFTQELADFLGVKVDSDIVQLQNWLRTEHRKVVEMEDGQEKTEVTLAMNKFLRAITANPIITSLQSTGLKLKRQSASAHSLKLGVKDSVQELFQVEEEMEKLYRVSNTGGLYDKTIGAEL